MGGILRVFEKVLEIVKSNEIRWVLAGSLASYFNGLNVKPKDIDILTNKDGVQSFYNLIKNYCTVKRIPEYSETDLYASFYSKYSCDGTNIEIMGNFKLKTSMGVIDIPFEKIWELSNAHQINSIEFKVIPLELQLIYNIFIPGKEERVNLTLQHFRENPPNSHIVKELKKFVNTDIWKI